MESRSYNFSTARKRSTQLKSVVISFPKEEDGAPRQKILNKECPNQVSEFKSCIAKFKDEAKCTSFKDALKECGKPAFRLANTTPGYSY